METINKKKNGYVAPMAKMHTIKPRKVICQSYYYNSPSDLEEGDTYNV